MNCTSSNKHNFCHIKHKRTCFLNMQKCRHWFFLECLYLNLIKGKICWMFLWILWSNVLLESIFAWHVFYISYRHVFWGPYEWSTLSKFFLRFSFKYLQVFYICCKPFIYFNIYITVDFFIFSFVLPLWSNHFDWLIPNDIWF